MAHPIVPSSSMSSAWIGSDRGGVHPQRHLLLVLMIMLCMAAMAGMAGSARADEISPAAKAELDKLSKTVDKLTADYDQKLEDLREKCALELAKIKDTELKQHGNITGANLVNSALTDLEKVLDDGTEKLSPPDGHLHILNAQYGTPDRWVDATTVITRYVRNDSLSNWDFTKRLQDVPPGPKTLIIDYQINGNKYHHVFKELKPFHIPLDMP